VPTAFTVGFAVLPFVMLPGPAQLKPEPLDVAAERTVVLDAQVSDPPVALAPGASVLLLTDAVAVLVHPLLEFSTVTVYVPVAFTVGFAVPPLVMVPGPLQLKIMLEVDAAESTVVLDAHVSVPPVALAPGSVVFVLTNAVAVFVQPPEDAVTVTVYVPSELTSGFAVVPPETIPGPAQLKLTPP